MSYKRTLISILSILLLVVALTILSGLLGNRITHQVGAQYEDGGQNFEMMNQAPMTDEEGNEYFYYEIMMAQEPISLAGQSQLKTDQTYFYNPELGEIDQIKVRDGQTVKKDAVLFTYKHEDKEKTYQLEDAKRKQTRLYNSRETLISNLSELTGNLYNYQGDWIDYDWQGNSKSGYYVIEEIGPADSLGASQSEGQANMEDGYDFADDYQSQVEAIKTQIRELNLQIEDLEIEISRLQDQNVAQVKAKSAGKVILNEVGKDDSKIPLVRIISDDISVTGTVSEYDFYLLKEKLPVTIYVNAEDRTLGGSLIAYDKYPQNQAPAGDDSTGPSAFMGPGGDAGSQYGFTVKPEDFIQPGFSVKVQIKAPGYVVSPAAVIEDGKSSYVFVNKEGKAIKTKVTVSNEAGNYVITRGLEEGDQVLLGASLLSDGQEIKTIDEMDVGVDGGQ